MTGVDVARGAALVGMMATHVLDTFDDASPTAATVVAAGRSAATFAVVAGVSVAFLSGGRDAVTGPARRGSSAGLVARALLVGAIGLLLGATDTGILVILPVYALLFLLAVPLLGLTARALALLAAAVAAAGPVLLVATADLDLPEPDADNPTFLTLVTEPVGLLVQLVLTGEYPVALYLAYLAAGLAIGRLDLRSPRVAARLLGAGLALAVTAQAVSWLLLRPLGGLDRLLGQADFRGDARDEAVAELLWSPDQGSSWWYLALASPHAHTPLDAAHVIGSATALLGAALLLARLAPAGRLLSPLAAAGAMPLTLYSAHVLVLETGLLDNSEGTLFVVLVVASMAFAVLWRRRFGRGPLERVVAAAAGRARRAAQPRASAVDPPSGTGRG